MHEKETIKKLRESIIFETAWLYESTKATKEEKEQTIEAVKVIWNRSIGRAGFGSFNELSISEKDIKEAVEFWNSKDGKVVFPQISKSDDDQSSS